MNENEADFLKANGFVYGPSNNDLKTNPQWVKAIDNVDCYVYYLDEDRLKNST